MPSRPCPERTGGPSHAVLPERGSADVRATGTTRTIAFSPDGRYARVRLAPATRDATTTCGRRLRRCASTAPASRRTSTRAHGDYSVDRGGLRPQRPALLHGAGRGGVGRDFVGEARPCSWSTVTGPHRAGSPIRRRSTSASPTSSRIGDDSVLVQRPPPGSARPGRGDRRRRGAPHDRRRPSVVTAVAAAGSVVAAVVADATTAGDVVVSRRARPGASATSRVALRERGIIPPRGAHDRRAVTATPSTAGSWCPRARDRIRCC